jgi:hypothetical protein
MPAQSGPTFPEPSAPAPAPTSAAPAPTPAAPEPTVRSPGADAGGAAPSRDAAPRTDRAGGPRAVARRATARRARAAERRAIARARDQASAALREARRDAERTPALTSAGVPRTPAARSHTGADRDTRLLGAALALCALALAGMGVVVRIRREWEPA